MAGTVNKVILIGRLGKDPETKTIPGGTTVTRFSIATDETWTDKAGEKQQRTDWHNIVAWGKLGEICDKYLTKGKHVYIEGSLRMESWEDRTSGEKKYRTDIVASQMTMLSAKDENSGGRSQDNHHKAQAPAASNERWNDDDDEVPF
jgi:single-strand DNA-binding protein